MLIYSLESLILTPSNPKSVVCNLTVGFMFYALSVHFMSYVFHMAVKFILLLA